MRFDLVWRKGRFTIDDDGTEFSSIQSHSIQDCISGMVDFKPKHRIRYKL
ncbi:MAG: hypothetical protein GY820_12425 [Gammaproteobacteria bacterium]|nr:hypothetical protein [Gammaproteobacteria bacterium]